MQLLIVFVLLLTSTAIAAAEEGQISDIAKYFGTYGYTEKICDNDGCTPFKNTATIAPHKDGALVNATLAFDFGHDCTLYNEVAHLKENKLIIERKNFRDELETVEVTLNGSKLSFIQNTKSQHSDFCGARASFSAAHPLQKDAAPHKSLKGQRFRHAPKMQS